MTIRKSTLRISTRMACAVLASAFFVATPIVATFAPAQAQQESAVSVEFRGALEPYGRWERHSRWGEVWVPAKVSRDWRPYTVGRWVYSNDWGWYWVSDEEEADWAGWPFITAAGYPIVNWAGRGFPAISGGTLHRNQRRSDRHDLEQHVRSDPVIPARRRSVQALPA